ncbi:MAG: homoserine O-acetyltransferase [Pseudomonadota bacterium]
MSTADQPQLMSEHTRYWQSEADFVLESGQVLGKLEIAYRTWGTLNAAGDNAVLICHALTGSADADDWWPGIIGEGLALDPRRDFIVCSNVIAGCYGSTGPLSVNPVTARRYGGNFPRATVRDMVAAQHLLIGALKINSLALIIGPSMGGMQVLEWASMYPEQVRAIAPIGVSAKHSAWCIGNSEAQRQAIYADENWCKGHYALNARPERGFAVARMMAMLSYRSWQNFESRFGRESDTSGGFTIESYLRYQGEKINTRFDAVSYVRLTEAMDSHDIGRGRDGIEKAMDKILVPALVVSVESDILYPPHEQQWLAERLPNARYRSLDSPHGHDGFLIDTEALGLLVKEFRQEPLALKAS